MEAMSGLVTRSFRAYGAVCAQKPWEMMFMVITATVSVITMVPNHTMQTYDHHHHHHHSAASYQEGPLKVGPPDTATPAGLPHHHHSRASGDVVYGIDSLVMPLLRCGAALYTYHQMRLLHRQGSPHVMGIAASFVCFTGFVFSWAVMQLLGSPVADLQDALIFFLLVVDVREIRRLSALALGSRSQRDAATAIAEGLALLGPGLSLDTLVEALLVATGCLTGVWRLHELCRYAVMSIVVNYLLLMTFFPAFLSLVMQMSPLPLPIDAPLGPPPQHPAPHACHSGHAHHNPVLQRVKVIMSAGLVVVHGICRFSLILQGDAPVMRMRNASHPSPPPYIPVRWLTVGLEQMFLVIPVAVLLVKYAMFEGRGELEQQILRRSQQERDHEHESSSGKKKQNSVSGNKGSGHLLPTVDANTQTDTTASSETSSHQNTTQQVSSSLKIDAAQESPICQTTTATVASNCQQNSPTFDLSCEQTNDNSCQQPSAETVAVVSSYQLSAGHVTSALDSSVSLVSSNVPCEEVAVRSLDECMSLIATEDGVQKLRDFELAKLVEFKRIKGYELEKICKDPLRAVRVRRGLMESKTKGALQALPYEGMDYSKVMGVSCENLVGYVPVPVGLAGPLHINGLSYHIPLATTEGCLVASTNRGCRALQQSTEGGVRCVVLEDAITRAPVVEFPSHDITTYFYNWVKQPCNKSILREAFDKTSRYARMVDVTPHIAGRRIHLRFETKTGDAMGMNMVSKGVEKALDAVRAVFPTMEVISISGNLCTDKKPSAINWVLGRGKSVVCWAVIPRHVVQSVLKTSVEALVHCHMAKNYEGSALAGSIGGNNAHAANIVAALYIACGQDPAQVVGSSNCMTQLMKSGEDLEACVNMPSLEVGTLGGGTGLPAQRACLNILGVGGAHPDSPGLHAQELAMVVASAVLAGELSLMAALTAGHLVNSHMKHNRAGPQAEQKGGPQAKQQVEPQAKQQVEPQAKQQVEPQAKQQVEPQAKQQVEPQAKQQVEPQAKQPHITQLDHQLQQLVDKQEVVTINQNQHEELEENLLQKSNNCKEEEEDLEQQKSVSRLPSKLSDKTNDSATNNDALLLNVHDIESQEMGKKSAKTVTEPDSVRAMATSQHCGSTMEPASTHES